MLNARGQRRQQRVVTLTGATPDPEPPVAVDHQVTRDVRTPDIVVIMDADGWAVAEDNRAVHTVGEYGMPTRGRVRRRVPGAGLHPPGKLGNRPRRPSWRCAKSSR